ncbi:DUF805 domain-containing protein [Pseudolabrys taiwanensis]|uniref:DUF805 domain-containing protein n=1 Tax=Pseudolabrys taiwanensis TaxID=331696 RepID=A0A345ZSY4_9HYPH|nr:DUF805 domain-containing protein [Pseudolabrys taiwanensis]AXK80031.1 DUF805 domain-containing protein [Pseudolabrys taiwanensis]
MNFQEAIKSGFRNYLTFSGRAPRSEFWFWVLFEVLVSIVANILDVAIFPFSDVSPLNAIVSVALFLPSLAVSVRRLHDIDRTGWWVLISLTVIGVVLLLIWNCLRGTIGANRFGPDPLAGQAP